MSSRIMNIIGIVIMVFVVVCAFPLSVPRLFGLQVYGIASESMEPDYPKWSVAYAKVAQPSDVEVGDVIVFTMGSGSTGYTIHRVTAKYDDEKAFVTKGDNNESADPNPVTYDRLAGRVVFSIPFLGLFASLFGSSDGYGLIIILFAVAFVLFVGADMLKKKRLKNKTGKL